MVTGARSGSQIKLSLASRNNNIEYHYMWDSGKLSLHNYDMLNKNPQLAKILITGSSANWRV